MFATVRIFNKPSMDVKRLHTPQKEILKTWNRINSRFNEGYFNYRQFKAKDIKSIDWFSLST